MHAKIIIILIAISFILSSINSIVQAYSRRQQQKHNAKIEELNKHFQYLQTETDKYKARLDAYQSQMSQAQLIIDSLNHKQAQLRSEIKNRDKQYQNIKLLLSAPKSNFADSTKSAILNNLPQ